MHDDRVSVKAAAMTELGCRLMAAPSVEEKADLLLLMFSYMKRFSFSEEILEHALTCIVRFMQTPTGNDVIDTFCSEMWAFIASECNRGSLTVLAQDVRVRRMEAGLVAALQVLGTRWGSNLPEGNM